MKRHCISEWGHDFRPDYRRIAELRTSFAGIPFLAFTATATDRVRDDIVERLALQASGDPHRELQPAEPHVSRGPRPAAVTERLIAWLRPTARRRGDRLRRQPRRRRRSRGALLGRRDHRRAGITPGSTR